MTTIVKVPSEIRMSESCSRRAFLRAGCFGILSVLATRPAAASVFRAISLETLLQASARVSVVTALAAECRYAEVAGTRRIVTDTRVRMERTLAGVADSETELMIRTLGGVVGDQGERVEGEALLSLGESGLVFLVPLRSGEQGIVAMAQGHYPLRADAAGVRRLGLSPRLPRMLPSSAVSAGERLLGLSVEAAERLMRQVRR
jgi:hypothetical protein